MTTRAPIGASQHESFAMARVLIMYAEWERQHQEALLIDRAMLLDFVAQHPRAFEERLPALARVLRGHGLEQRDLSDLFVQRRFPLLREAFSVTAAGLIARGLVADPQPSADASPSLRLTPLGAGVVQQFTSSLSFGLRAIHEVLCSEWHRRSLSELRAEIREMLPNESMAIADLALELPQWFGEEQ